MNLRKGPGSLAETVSAIIALELAGNRQSLGQTDWNAGKFEDAARMFEKACLECTVVEFLNLPAGEAIGKKARAVTGLPVTMQAFLRECAFPHTAGRFRRHLQL